MNNTALIALAWLAVAAHVAVGTIAWRQGGAVPMVPLINFVTAACVVVYWIREWFIVLTRGILWYATDQLLPAYAVLVCVFSAMALAGKVSAGPLHWTIFAVHLTVCIGAALFFTFFKMNRLF